MISSKTLAAVAAAMVVLGSAVAMAKEKKIHDAGGAFT